jgi:hypothetical protein
VIRYTGGHSFRHFTSLTREENIQRNSNREWLSRHRQSHPRNQAGPNGSEPKKNAPDAFRGVKWDKKFWAGDVYIYNYNEDDLAKLRSALVNHYGPPTFANDNQHLDRMELGGQKDKGQADIWSRSKAGYRQ